MAREKSVFCLGGKWVWVVGEPLCNRRDKRRDGETVEQLNNSNHEAATMQCYIGKTPLVPLSSFRHRD